MVEGRTLAPNQNGYSKNAQVNTAVSTVVNDGKKNYPEKSEKKKLVSAGVSRDSDSPTISIKQALKTGIQRPKPKSKPTDKKDASDGVPTKNKVFEFTQAEVLEQFKEFARIRNKDERIRISLSTVEIEIKEQKTLIKTFNNLQLEDINSLKLDLENYLRQTFKNPKIELMVRLEQTQSKKRVYDETEILKNLSKKNPSLALLKKKLTLDFE